MRPQQLALPSRQTFLHHPCRRITPQSGFRVAHLSTTVVLGRIYEDARRNRLTNHSLIAGPVAALRAHADHFLELAEWFDSFQHMDEIEQAFASAREEIG